MKNWIALYINLIAFSISKFNLRTDSSNQTIENMSLNSKCFTCKQQELCS